MKHTWYAYFGTLSLTLALGATASATVTESFSSGRPATVSGEIRAIGSAVMEAQKDARIERFMGRNDAVHRIAIQAYSENELKSAVAAENAKPRHRTPLAVGIGRDVPSELRSVPLGSLAWETLSDGSRAAKIAIDAEGAAAIRVGYRVSGPVEGLSLRFADNVQSKVYAGSPVESGVRAWSPTFESAGGVIELALKPGYEPSVFTLSVEKISQLVSKARQSKGNNPRAPSSCSSSPFQIGCADACNVDLACVQNPSNALREIAAATVKFSFVADADGKSYLCSGTLLNSNTSPRRPYIFTAAHCISSQREAASVETYWFFDAVGCNSLSIPPFQRVTTGASLKVADGNLDTSLLEMNSNPPTGAFFAGWDASVIPRSAILVGVHHPSGDLKTFSEGSMQGYDKLDSLDTFIKVRWTPNKGTTEQGSSGSGIFTFNSNCAGSGVACYQLRGGLEGGAASCQSPSSPDYYSRMDLYFTQLAPYLAPSAIIPSSNSSEGTMVEFFNPQFDYYFMTSRESEKSALDNARSASGIPLWYRTGFWFKVDPFATPQTSSLTRYFIPGAAKSGTRGSHFYTALNADKQSITSTGREVFTAGCVGVPNTFFCNEGTDSFVAAPIGAGTGATCATGERRIWRVFRGQPNYFDDGNHRYLTNEGMYNYMVGELGWNAENVNMCVRP